MNQTRLKLLMAATGLLVSLVMVAGGTFAWFTISQKAEVTGISVTMEATGEEYPFELSLDYGEKGSQATWTTELFVDSKLTGKGPMRPISTADMVHWYLPEYAADGAVASFYEVALEDVANRQEELTSYLVYFDLWVRTRDQDSTYALKLNNPNKNNDGSLHVEQQETVYGTYALWLPQRGADGKFANPMEANDAMACLRIGFQMLEEDENGVETVANSLIFEPNADMRSDFTKYTSSGGVTAANGLGNLEYIASGNAHVTVGDYATKFHQNVTYPTSVPKWQPPVDGNSEPTYTMTPQNTFQQKKSEWDTTKLAALTESQTVDSRCIKTLGAFVGDGDSPEMAQINKENVQKVRIFLWLEGQDIDCWNQIAGGGIFANLEFRGDEVPQS